MSKQDSTIRASFTLEGLHGGRIQSYPARCSQPVGVLPELEASMVSFDQSCNVVATEISNVLNSALAGTRDIRKKYVQL